MLLGCRNRSCKPGVCHYAAGRSRGECVGPDTRAPTMPMPPPPSVATRQSSLVPPVATTRTVFEHTHTNTDSLLLSSADIAPDRACRARALPSRRRCHTCSGCRSRCSSGPSSPATSRCASRSRLTPQGREPNQTTTKIPPPLVGRLEPDGVRVPSVGRVDSVVGAYLADGREQPSPAPVTKTCATLRRAVAVAVHAS